MTTIARPQPNMARRSSTSENGDNGDLHDAAVDEDDDVDYTKISKVMLKLEQQVERLTVQMTHLNQTCLPPQVALTTLWEEQSRTLNQQLQYSKDDNGEKQTKNHNRSSRD
jgi:hypothetical protein